MYEARHLVLEVHVLVRGSATEDEVASGTRVVPREATLHTQAVNPDRQQKACETMIASHPRRRFRRRDGRHPEQPRHAAYLLQVGLPQEGRAGCRASSSDAGCAEAPARLRASLKVVIGLDGVRQERQAPGSVQPPQRCGRLARCAAGV